MTNKAFEWTDTITDEQMDRHGDFTPEEFLIFQNDYFMTTMTEEGFTYVKKTVLFGNPEDITNRDPRLDLEFLVGATIQRIGFTDKTNEGGLAIQYSRDNESKIAVFGFNDLGFWIEANVPCR